MQKMRLQSLLVTRGKDGMVVFPAVTSRLLYDLRSDEVLTLRAGDTVIATYTAALAGPIGISRTSGELRWRHCSDETR